MAAVLAVGEGAVLSHAAAAWAWGLLPEPAGPVDVTLPGREARNRPGIRVRQAAHFPPEDATRHRNLPVTTPNRTLLDLATTPHLATAVEQAQLHRLTTHANLTHFLTSRSSCRGATALRAATQEPAQMTRSQAERRFLDLIKRARLPTPAANTRVGGHEVDFLWPDRRLVVEIDGWAFHSSRAAFERDRIRDADLQTRGYRILRFTPRRLVQEPEAVVAAVAAA
jgi:very-short-patch-repair endonuclease